MLRFLSPSGYRSVWIISLSDNMPTEEENNTGNGTKDAYKNLFFVYSNKLVE